MSATFLNLRGVRQNNLKNVDLDLPLGKTIVLTGPSGSGKSSLAFETIFAEGQRRYMQSLSTYARQFLDKYQAPDADLIHNIPPTIALEQINPVRNSRATVGTSTEVYDFFRLVFEKFGELHCQKCGTKLMVRSLDELVEGILNDWAEKSLVTAFKVNVSKKDLSSSLLEWVRMGYSRLISGENLELIEEWVKKSSPQTIPLYIVTDRILLKSLSLPKSVRFKEALESSMRLGDRWAYLFEEKEKKYHLKQRVTIERFCPNCDEMFRENLPISFSFNHPLGACEMCKGFGNTLELDKNLVVPNPGLPLSGGAIEPFTKPSLRQWQRKLLQFCKEKRIDADLPYSELPEEDKNLIFNGQGHFKGVRFVFKRLEKKKYKLRVRVFVARYQSPVICTSCGGARLNPRVLKVKVSGLNIYEVTKLSVEECLKFWKKFFQKSGLKDIQLDPINQIIRRLTLLQSLGLGYLTFDRLTKTLSGGEYQRISLATQLSQGLVDTLYVLDEPTIGLHPKDTELLITILNELNELGNTIVVVEHDPDIIHWGEFLVDLGPGSGKRGGDIMFSGSREQFSFSETPTSLALREWKVKCHDDLKKEPIRSHAWLELKGAKGHNLKNVDVEIPLKALISITGVSGSGKSTLIVDTLYQALNKMFHGYSEPIAKFDSIRGFDELGDVKLIDQTPIGKSSRSNPITFLKGFDEIRRLFSETREALQYRLKPGDFSFNVKGGRCDDCEGEGRIRVEMVFMEDLWVPCETCHSKRYKSHILKIRYKGKNIHDCLQLTIDEAFDFFKGSSSLQSKLSLCQDVGLGYLELGQPSFSLSGGEAQRIKIARELGAVDSMLLKSSTLFILDEPTTGLHFDEINKLITILKRLVKYGHSVILIEHNLQVICASDYVIDLGPNGGDKGGRVVASGSPHEILNHPQSLTGRALKESLA